MHDRHERRGLLREEDQEYLADAREAAD